MNRIRSAALALALAAPIACLPLLVPVAALAAEVTTVGNTAVILPWGDIVVAVAQPLMAALAPFIAIFVIGLITKFAPWLFQWVSKVQIEGALGRIEAYGLNATMGAAKGKTLTADIANAALATAVQYGADNAKPLLINAMGGLPGLAEKLFRRMDLGEDASAATVLHPVLDQINAGAIAKKS